MAKLVRDDEEQLIARSQHGDVNAFNELILRYQQMTYGAVLRMLGDADVAADITQDAFIAAFRGISSFRGGSSFRGWAPRIASHLVRDHWRTIPRHPGESLEGLTDPNEQQYGVR